MKIKSVLHLGVLLLFACILFGCGEKKEHVHEWDDGSCTTPKMCITCGQTDGDTPVHAWVEGTCDKPKHCSKCDETEGDEVHSWVMATCADPQHCSACGITEGDVLKHSWVKAACDSPKHCSVCGITEGDVFHRWDSPTPDSPRVCRECNLMEPMELPKSGQVFLGKNLRRGSELSIEPGPNKSCYVKFKRASGKEVFSFFVRAGSSVTVPVPSGRFYVYFAHGTDWYGLEYLFGDDTIFTEDTQLRNFEKYTYTYKFNEAYIGDSSETPMYKD